MSSPVGHSLLAIALGTMALHLSAVTVSSRFGLPVVNRGAHRSTPATRAHTSPTNRQAMRQGARMRLEWPLIVLLVVSGNAADLDFVPGFLIGDVNRWHHIASHSLLACLVWGVAVFLLFRWFNNAGIKGSQSNQAYTGVPSTRRVFWIAVSATVAYASHLLLDWLTQDTRAPIGIPLLWPADLYSLSGWTPLGGVRHGVPGDTLWTVLGEVFSAHNAKVAVRECLLASPVYLALMMLVRSSPRRA